MMLSIPVRVEKKKEHVKLESLISDFITEESL